MLLPGKGKIAAKTTVITTLPIPNRVASDGRRIRMNLIRAADRIPVQSTRSRRARTSGPGFEHVRVPPFFRTSVSTNLATSDSSCPCDFTGGIPMWVALGPSVVAAIRHDAATII